KSLKNFRLVLLCRRYVQRRRAFAVIMPCSGWGGIEQLDGHIELGSKKRTSEARTGSEADRNPTLSAPNITKRFGHRMTHSQGSNSRQPLGVDSLARTVIPGPFELSADCLVGRAANERTAPGSRRPSAIYAANYKSSQGLAASARPVRDK